MARDQHRSLEERVLKLEALISAASRPENGDHTPWRWKEGDPDLERALQAYTSNEFQRTKSSEDWRTGDFAQD